MRSSADQLSSALESIVATFGAMVRSVGRRHRLLEADLDEVMQEVRIRVWRACETAEQIERVNASYVYRTATSAALGLLRRRRARSAEVTDAVDDHTEASLPGTHRPDDDLELRELAEQVAGAIETIPASRRAVVRMYLAGYDRLEIGELMGWSEAKTRNLIYRGLADLRARLSERGIQWPPKT